MISTMNTRRKAPAGHCKARTACQEWAVRWKSRLVFPRLGAQATVSSSSKEGAERQERA